MASISCSASAARTCTWQSERTSIEGRSLGTISNYELSREVSKYGLYAFGSTQNYMNFDRHAQFDPIPGLSNAALNARLANDAATTAMDNEQATVDGINQKLGLLHGKIYGGSAGPSDFADYGSALNQFAVESAKLPALQTTQAQTRDAWFAARLAFLNQANSIDQNPGAIEKV